jgi:regulator of replication initiation timing
MAQLADMQKQIDDLRAENQYLVRENTDLLERVDDLENGKNDTDGAIRELFSLVDYPVDSVAPFDEEEVNEEDFDT